MGKPHNFFHFIKFHLTSFVKRLHDESWTNGMQETIMLLRCDMELLAIDWDKSMA